MKNIILLIVIVFASFFIFQSCRKYPEIKNAKYVDVKLFMGNWYVIANIPTFIEKGAHNAIEKYEQKSNGVINTTFRFNKGSFNGPEKKYSPTGFITDDPSNALWKMQFSWPFKSEFVIVYVDAEYKYTIIGRSKRDYVWIMAREKNIDKKNLDLLINIAVEEGYKRSLIQIVPHM